MLKIDIHPRTHEYLRRTRDSTSAFATPLWPTLVRVTTQTLGVTAIADTGTDATGNTTEAILVPLAVNPFLNFRPCSNNDHRHRTGDSGPRPPQGHRRGRRHTRQGRRGLFPYNRTVASPSSLEIVYAASNVNLVQRADSWPSCSKVLPIIEAVTKSSSSSIGRHAIPRIRFATPFIIAEHVATVSPNSASLNSYRAS